MEPVVAVVVFLWVDCILDIIEKTQPDFGMSGEPSQRDVVVSSGQRPQDYGLYTHPTGGGGQKIVRVWKG